MWVHSEQIKQVALLLVQSKLKNVATAVFNCADRIQKRWFMQTTHRKALPFTATVSGSCLNRAIKSDNICDLR